MNDERCNEREEQIPEWAMDASTRIVKAIARCCNREMASQAGVAVDVSFTDDSIRASAMLISRAAERENADLRQQLAEANKQLHCMELRAKSAEAITNMAGVRTCDCCEQPGSTVKYHDAAGYLCDKCGPKVMATRESVRQHLQRETELEKQLAEARAEAASWQDCCEVLRRTDLTLLQLSAQAAELATLREGLKTACDELVKSTAECGNLMRDNATLRERLAAAERFRFGSLLFSCSNNGWECFRMSDGSYLGDPPHSNTFIYKTFDEAYQAAIAAGWIPPSTKGEG